MKPSPFQILKYLPKTNCKECGFETCLALATHIFAYGPASLKKCPHISKETIDSISNLFTERDESKSGTMIELWHEFRKKLSQIDFKNFEGKEGIYFKDGKLAFKFLSQEVTVDKNDINIEGEEASEHTKILIFYYLQCYPKLGGSQEFWDYKSFYSKLKVRDVKQEEFEVKIQTHVGNNLGALRTALIKLGAEDFSDYRDVYDLSMIVNIFPCIPLLVLYRQGEEDFPPFCKIMFDKGCNLCFDSEGLEYLADYFVEKIIENLEKKEGV